MKSFRLVQIALAGILLIEGLDKFPNFLVDWTQYFPYGILNSLHIPMWLMLYGSGIAECFAGVLILMRPRIGGFLAALIFIGIVITLILDKNYYNIAVIDFGLFLISLAVVQRSQEVR